MKRGQADFADFANFAAITVFDDFDSSNNLEWGEGRPGEGEGGNARRARESEHQRFPLSIHRPNFYDFFPRAIAPFNGTFFKNISRHTVMHIKLTL